MTYKEFKNWCNDRSHDGCWGLTEAITCISAYEVVSIEPFWKREKVWNNLENREEIELMITKTNEIIERVKKDTVF
jgi:hypothetical protein